MIKRKKEKRKSPDDSVALDEMTRKEFVLYYLIVSPRMAWDYKTAMPSDFTPPKLPAQSDTKINHKESWHDLFTS